MSRYSFQRTTTCPFCNKQLKSGGGVHIYKCKFRPIGMNNDDVIMSYCKENFPDISEKELLNLEYNTNLLSLPDLERKYGIPGGKVTFLLDYYELHRRNASEGCLLCAQPKIRKTCLEKYGTLNVLSKDTIIYHKRNEVVMNKYSVSNVFKLPEIKKKCIDDNTFITRYGVDRKTLISIRSKQAWKNKSDRDRETWLYNSILSNRSVITSSRATSKLELKIVNALGNMNIPHITQFPIFQGSIFKFYDIKLLYSNIIIEVNGDFYHANPDLYLPNDIMTYPGRTLTALEVWNDDKNRKIFANRNGYEVMYIWENEVKNLSSVELCDYLQNKLGFSNVWSVVT